MGNLGGGHHYDPPRLLIGKAAVIFNVAVLDRGGVVPALHLHKVRLLNGCLVISPANIRVLKDVAWKFLVDLGCLALHSLLWVQDEGQLLVLHLQRPDALGRSHLVLRDHHGHLIPIIADMAV